VRRVGHALDNTIFSTENAPCRSGRLLHVRVRPEKKCSRVSEDASSSGRAAGAAKPPTRTKHKHKYYIDNHTKETKKQEARVIPYCDPCLGFPPRRGGFCRPFHGGRAHRVSLCQSSIIIALLLLLLLLGSLHFSVRALLLLREVHGLALQHVQERLGTLQDLHVGRLGLLDRLVVLVPGLGLPDKALVDLLEPIGKD